MHIIICLQRIKEKVHRHCDNTYYVYASPNIYYGKYEIVCTKAVGIKIENSRKPCRTDVLYMDDYIVVFAILNNMSLLNSGS